MTDHPDPSPWYLAQLKPNCAGIAQRNLARQGFAVFLPLERTTRRQGKRLVTVRRPYFPGYVFVGTHGAASPWRAIQSTQGIARLVRFGIEPAPVPRALVAELQQACDAEGCIALQAALTAGDNVHITHGPFASFIGQVENCAPEDRAWVLIDVMGQATRVSLPRRDLRLAS